MTSSRRWIGFDSTLACLGALEIRVERDRGEASDEHDLDVGIELGRAAGEFDAVHLRHDDIGEQKLERLLAQALIGGKAVVVGDDVKAGVLQRLDQKAPHVDVVFREQDFRHVTQPPAFAGPLHSISRMPGKHGVKVALGKPYRAMDNSRWRTLGNIAGE